MVKMILPQVIAERIGADSGSVEQIGEFDLLDADVCNRVIGLAAEKNFNAKSIDYYWTGKTSATVFAQNHKLVITSFVSFSVRRGLTGELTSIGDEIDVLCKRQRDLKDQKLVVYYCSNHLGEHIIVASIRPNDCLQCS
jgi:hypothetical protein